MSPHAAATVNFTAKWVIGIPVAAFLILMLIRGLMYEIAHRRRNRRYEEARKRRDRVAEMADPGRDYVGTRHWDRGDKREVDALLADLPHYPAERDLYLATDPAPSGTCLTPRCRRTAGHVGWCDPWRGEPHD